MANNVLKALNSLSDQVPGLNQKALKQTQAARDISMQKQLGGPAQPGATAAQQAQATATQQALQAGQDLVTQRQQATAQAGQIRQAALQEKAQQGQQALAQQKMQQQQQIEAQRQEQLKQLRQQEAESRRTVLQSDIESSTRIQQAGMDMDTKLQIATVKQREDLARLGTDLKGKLLDARLAFGKDERGRKFSNERQMADYLAATAKSRQEFNSKMSQMQAVAEQKNAILRQTQAQLQAALERGYITEKDDLDFEAKKALAQYNMEIQKKIQKEQANARNKQAMIQAGGMILGGAIGMAGGPQGAALGANIGGAAASMLGGAF